ADDELREVLYSVNLANLPERAGGLDIEKDWAHFLSSGEQQRLSFARLLLQRPRYAFLDEATSALDPPNEMLLYSRLAKTSIVYASISHRASLDQFHDQVLKLHSDGEWGISRVENPNELYPGAAFGGDRARCRIFSGYLTARMHPSPG